MEEDNVIRYGLLGSFSYGDSGTVLRAGKKALSFLQYMIVHHDRSISCEELIEQFWPENNSSSPSNALRYMLYKVRTLLENIFPEQEDLLQTFQGCYAWNPQVRLVLDSEQFETACLEARKTAGEEQLQRLLDAAALYRGDFLASNDSEWALVLRQYYRGLFLDVCKTALPLLHKKEKWTELLAICGQGYRIDFAMEEFTVYQMRALIALGQPEQAMETYEAFREKMFQEFEILPSETVEQLYTLAVGLRKKDMGVPDIFRLVCEDDREQKAFFCTFEVFQNIVALEKRHLERSGQSSALVIVSLGEQAVPATDARRLERVLLDGLRAGDPVARLDAGSYILMLTGASVENARIVMGRVDCSFHSTYRYSRARISYWVEAL